MPVVCALCFWLCVSTCYVLFLSGQVIIFQRTEKINGDVNQVGDERNRRASIFLPINPLKMAKINSSRFDVSNAFTHRTTHELTQLCCITHLCGMCTTELSCIIHPPGKCTTELSCITHPPGRLENAPLSYLVLLTPLENAPLSYLV